MLLQYLANGLCRSAAVALVAVGFALIFSTARIFHIAHASAFVLGGYAFYVACALWAWPLVLAVVFALLAAAAAGALMEVCVFAPLARRRASGTILMISSLGVHIVIENLVALGFGNQTQILRTGSEPVFVLGSVLLSQIQLIQAAAGVACVTAYVAFLRSTSLGQLCRAVADDPELASALGAPVSSLRIVAFALGSTFAGLGAILVAADTGIDPHAGFPALLTATVACIIAGAGNLWAPAAGALVIGLSQSLIVWGWSAKWEQAAVFTVLCLFVVLRPRGLIANTQRAEEGP